MLASIVEDAHWCFGYGWLASERGSSYRFRTAMRVCVLAQKGEAAGSHMGRCIRRMGKQVVGDGFMLRKAHRRCPLLHHTMREGGQERWTWPMFRVLPQNEKRNCFCSSGRSRWFFPFGKVSVGQVPGDYSRDGQISFIYCPLVGM